MSDTMKPFMEPNSVAIIGVSRATGPGSNNVLENMIISGFAGRTYPVNPHADEILGIKAYPSVLYIPEDVDLAIIMISRLEVLRIVRECIHRRIKAIAIVNQGFADADDEGKMMQAEIVRIAREGGARVLGPNTWGTLNAFNNFSCGISPVALARIPIGVICQTGYFLGRPGWAGKGIDLGNMCDVDFVDGLEYYENDPSIEVIFLYIEGIGHGKRFMEVATRVARKKPIVALKTGRQEEAARAIQSHTGTLVGRDEAYDAAFRQCGVIRVSAPDEFEDLVKAFPTLPLMKGPGMAVITGSGGIGIITVDLLRKYDLRLARLSPQTLSLLNALAPPWQKTDNPADIWAAIGVGGHPFGEVFLNSLDALLQDEEVHAILVLYFQPMSQVEQTKLLDIVERGGGKPIVIALDGLVAPEPTAALEKTGRIAVFPTIERGLRALSRLHQRWRYLAAIEQGA